MKLLPQLLVFAAFALGAGSVLSQKKDEGTYTDPASVDADYALQGEYAGTLGEDQKYGAQIVALGDGKFAAVPCPGGLPGDGWDGVKPREWVESSREGDKVSFEGKEWKAVLEGAVVKVSDKDGAALGELKKVERKSPTLGKEAPEGAVVLFDGSTAEHFQGGKMTEDGLLQQGVTSKQKFRDHSIHIEFRLPYKPKARGQGRGNSGLYMQGRHEIQMLDSFGLKGEQNECGGVYSVGPPKTNMCFPPLTWQTYDIDFTAAKFDGEGKKTSNAKMTVRHNGVVIHKDLDVPHATTASKLKEGPEPGPVYLQNHGNPVYYRNIWVVEKK